jgi:hypothetical protein
MLIAYIRLLLASHVVQQYPLQLEYGFMVHNDGARILS